MLKILNNYIHPIQLCFLCLICVKEKPIESDVCMGFFSLQNTEIQYYNTEIRIPNLLHIFIFF